MRAGCGPNLITFNEGIEVGAGHSRTTNWSLINWLKTSQEGGKKKKKTKTENLNKDGESRLN